MENTNYYYYCYYYYYYYYYYYFIFIFIVSPCILKSMLFTHQQMYCLLSLERFKMYTNIAPICFGLRPSSGSLYLAWLKLY
jgi:hypothetical protein